MSQTVFMTGATGYAGRYVLEELLQRGATVRALTRWPVRLPGCETVSGSLDRLDRLDPAIGQSDAIVHLASSRADERETVLRQDVIGTGRLVELWARGPFVYASSAVIHGVPTGPLTEQAPLNPTGWYDVGKVWGEFAVSDAAGTGGRGAGVSLRPALIFAANARNGDRQMLGLVWRLCREGTTFVFDSEEALETAGSSFIGGRDFGRATADAMGLVGSGAYFITSGFCSWRSLIECINKRAGTRAQAAVRPGDRAVVGEYRLPRSRTFLDDTRFRQLSGFEPRDSLDEIVEELVASSNRQLTVRSGPRPGLRPQPA